MLEMIKKGGETHEEIERQEVGDKETLEAECCVEEVGRN